MWYSGLIAFVHPWILAALILLPAIWWLLRAIPPTPKAEYFPAIRLLQGLPETEQSPVHTPWWLLLLRLLIAALIIVGLARPLLYPSPEGASGGVLILVIDDGWASGPQWEARRSAMADVLTQAERHAQDVLLLSTAEAEPGSQPPILMPAAAARAVAASLQPKPWRLDRAAAAKRLTEITLSDAQRRNITSLWLSDGLAGTDATGAEALNQILQQFGPVTVMLDPPEKDIVALLEPRATEDGFEINLARPRAGAPLAGEVQALGEDGNILASAPVKFLARETGAAVQIMLPSGVRNAMTQLRVTGMHSPASVWLMDDRWKRRSAGVVSGAGSEAAQPLLDDAFYLERAMIPFADIRKGTISALLSAPLSMLVLADIGRIVGHERKLVEEWLEKGGLLVRFAGPRMVEQSDDLIPVKLRQGGRELGGALSWDVPARLAPFPENSPFSGLSIPADVTVERQILAQPDAALTAKTWASLEDGTPLVTAGRRGKGWNILFHVTANMRWSNLPASGLYVGMLQRLAALAQGVSGAEASRQTPLSALVMLDGLGQLRSPSGSVRPYMPDDTLARIGPHLPPGYYGANNFRVALNLNRTAEDLRPLTEISGANYQDYGPRKESDAGPWLLLAALILWLLDGVIALALPGRLPAWAGRKPAGAGGALGLSLLAICFAAGSALAQERRKPVEPAPQAALETRLAYVVTGDARVDAMSAAGLAGLTKILRERTAFDAADPMGVKPESDELVFFPLIYWPMTVKQQLLSEKALIQIDAYMKNGGTILFDTRDQISGFNPGRDAADDPGPGLSVLREILKSLDIPPLAQVSEEHVLTRTYYLLRDFPGRYTGGQLWVAAIDGTREHQTGDGVSAIVIGSNDWASAWAVDNGGAPLLPVEPGGEAQRERAYRTGVNLVMYSLTGNYKADQVHVPVLLERLGQ